MTLLEKAKIVQRRKRMDKITDEEIELAVGWLKGEIGVAGACRAMGLKPCGPAQYRIAIFLREGYRRGKFKLRFI